MEGEQSLPISYSGVKFDPRKAYAEAMGEDAMERQVRLGRERYACCLWLRSGGHSPLCRQHQYRKASR